jgi:hypothetical protein
MHRRARLSVVLIAGGVVLLVAIAIGIAMGNRVLGQVAGRVPSFSTTPVPLATASPGFAANVPIWKRTQVMSVATDPHFPDPRVTPEPEVVPTKPPTPRPTHSPLPTPSADSEAVPYTSPPMPIPLVTHGDDESAQSPEPGAT